MSVWSLVVIHCENEQNPGIPMFRYFRNISYTLSLALSVFYGCAAHIYSKVFSIGNRKSEFIKSKPKQMTSKLYQLQNAFYLSFSHSLNVYMFL